MFEIVCLVDRAQPTCDRIFHRIALFTSPVKIGPGPRRMGHPMRYIGPEPDKQIRHFTAGPTISWLLRHRQGFPARFIVAEQTWVPCISFKLLTPKRSAFSGLPIQNDGFLPKNFIPGILPETRSIQCLGQRSNQAGAPGG